MGCAFTVHDVAVDYSLARHPNSPNALKYVAVGEFTDQRGTSNPKLLMHMRNLNGDVTSGGWQAEKPIAQIIRDGLVQAIEGLDSLRSDRPLRLSGQLMDFRTEFIAQGMFSAGANKGVMTHKFQLTHLGTGEIIWQDTFVATVQGSFGAVELFSRTLSELIYMLVLDPYFIQQLSKNTEQSGSIQLP